MAKFSKAGIGTSPAVGDGEGSSAPETPQQAAAEQMAGNMAGAPASQNEHPVKHRPHASTAPFTP